LASVGRDHLACSAAWGQGVCANRKGVRRAPLKELILEGLRQRLMALELVERRASALQARWLTPGALAHSAQRKRG
jgi:hypothetical protein